MKQFLILKKSLSYPQCCSRLDFCCRLDFFHWLFVTFNSCFFIICHLLYYSTSLREFQSCFFVFFFSKIVKINEDCTLSSPAFFNYPIYSICWIVFRPASIFFCQRKSTPINYSSRCIHNLTNILWYNLHLDLLLIFLSLCIILYLNQLVDHRSFFH